MGKTKVFLKECQVQNSNQYDAFGVWHLLKEKPRHLFLACKENGQEPRYMFKDDELELFCETTEKEETLINEDDRRDRYCIGVLSSEDSESIIKYVEAGWGRNLFDVVISKFDPEEDESKRMKVAIFIKGPETEQTEEDKKITEHRGVAK